MQYKQKMWKILHNFLQLKRWKVVFDGLIGF